MEPVKLLIQTREHILWQKYWGEHANNIDKQWSFSIPFSLTSAEIGEKQNDLFKEIIRKATVSQYEQAMGKKY